MEGREMPRRERVIIQSYAEKDKQKKERKVASIFGGGGTPKPAPG